MNGGENACELRQTQLCQKKFLGRYEAVALRMYLESKAEKVGSVSHTLATPGLQQLGARCWGAERIVGDAQEDQPGPPEYLLRSRTASSDNRAHLSSVRHLT